MPTPSSRPAGDSFADRGTGSQRPTRRPAPDPFAVSGRTVRGAQPRPASDDPNDPAAWGDLADDWTEPGGSEWEELPAAEPERRPVPSRRPPRETARARTRARPTLNLGAARLPAFVGRSNLLTDQVSGALIGANLLSLIVMVIRLGTQLGRLPPSIVVHVDAAGIPDLWGTPAVLWRLPLIAGMSLLMNFVVAWFVAPIDRFAARFALAAALGVQLIVWVAVLDFV